MGQSSSVTTIPRPDREGIITNELEFLHEQIRKHSLTLKQLTLLSYDDFQGKVNELNALSSKFVDCNGKQLLFEIKSGSDTNVLWKGTVRVKCIKLDPESQKVEKCRELNLKQFLQVYNTLQQHLNMGNVEQEIRHGLENADDSNIDSVASGSSAKPKPITIPALAPLNASIFLDKLAELPDDDKPGAHEDCCICMERKPEVSLPCAHSYCLACIEQWNVNNKTCPICREALETTDDTWVLEDRPDPLEVTKEIQKSLFDLTK